MNLDDLPASELRRIDAVCMDFENRLRAGETLEIDRLVQKHGGPHASLLRSELELVRDEVKSNVAEPHKTGSDAQQLSSEKAADLERVMPAANTAIGPFLIQELIGRGGMGMVFSALDQRLNRQVAIKMLAVHPEKREALTTRFDREAKALAALSHPNIVELFDVGVFNGLPYAVMEFLDGELLRTRMQTQTFSADQVRSLGASIADALAAAHRAKVVHRDLKPENIMLVQLAQGRAKPHDSMMVKLFDFGLSRAPTGYQDFSETPDLLDSVAHRKDQDSPETSDSAEDQNPAANQGSPKDGKPITTPGRSVEETGAGVIMGTPGYMAPEQVRGEKVTPAADIFSLGCVLFEAFYGQLPFDGHTYSKRFAATLHKQPSTDQARRSVDPTLAVLIDECLQKDPGKRPDSADEIVSRLRASPAALSQSSASIPRRTWLIAGSGAIAVVASSSFWFRGDGDSQRRRRETLTEIQSLAVLSIADGDRINGSRPSTDTGIPETPKLPAAIGQSPLGRGEEISALLVHELTRLSDLSIPRFRPLSAETPEQFRSIGKLLEVDALMTGEIRTVGDGPAAFVEIDLQIISATTGKQIWGNRLQSDAPDNLLLQSRLVSEIASVIGKRLTSTADEPAPPTLDSFRCLVDAQTRSDPDSRLGLEMALQCFQNAKSIDRRFTEPIAGTALTSITLAAQTDNEQAIQLIRQARKNVDEALRMDPDSIDGRLAQAMLEWQTVGRFEPAETHLRELLLIAPNHWQVHHQYGLLLLTLGKTSSAIESLRQAQLLNPVSVTAKIDAARAQWVAGNIERAITDAKRIRDHYRGNELAKGLLVDLYEQQQRFNLAAEEQGIAGITPSTSAQEYFDFRNKKLLTLPYGPFGRVCNHVILELRTNATVDDQLFAQWVDPLPPMFSLLLAIHPAFARVRRLPRAQELLPHQNRSSIASAR